MAASVGTLNKFDKFSKNEASEFPSDVSSFLLQMKEKNALMQCGTKKPNKKIFSDESKNINFSMAIL